MKLTLPFLILSVTLLLGCKKPLDGVNLIYQTKEVKTSVTVEFINAQTGKPIGFENPGERVSFTVVGKDKSKVTSDLGNQTFKVGGGTSSIHILDNVVPSVLTPLEFGLKIKATGYLDIYEPVILTSEGHHFIRVNLAKRVSPPNGVSYIRRTTLETSPFEGTLTPYSLESKLIDENQNELISRFSIQEGTRLFNESNVALSGKMMVTLANYNPRVASSNAIIPKTIAVKSGQRGALRFLSAFSLDIFDDAKNEVKTFNKPISMAIEIPNELKDLDGNNVIEGSIIPVWSLNEESNRWQPEGNAVVSINPTGKLVANFNMTHLSSWGIGYFYSACPNPISVTIQSPYTTPATGQLVVATADGYILSQQVISIRNGSVFSLTNLPNNIGVRLVVYKNTDTYHLLDATDIIHQSIISNPCGIQTYNLAISGLAFDRIEVVFNGTCTNRPGQQIRPSMPLYYYDMVNPDKRYYLGQMTNGRIETQLLRRNSSYKIGGILGGNYTISPDSYTIGVNGATNNTTGIFEPFVWSQLIANNICNRL